jgi:hypothetical protein
MGRLIRVVFPLSCVALFLYAMGSDAEARRRIRLGRGISPGQTTSGPMLTREELRRCIRLQDSINSLSDRIDDMATSQPWNVSEHDDMVREVNAEVQSFNSDCAGKAYYASDMRAIQGGASTSDVIDSQSVITC